MEISYPESRHLYWDGAPVSWAWAMKTWTRFLSLDHRPGYWRNLPYDWPSTAWAYSEKETENRPWSLTHAPDTGTKKTIGSKWHGCRGRTIFICYSKWSTYKREVVYLICKLTFCKIVPYNRTFNKYSACPPPDPHYRRQSILAIPISVLAVVISTESGWE